MTVILALVKIHWEKIYFTKQFIKIQLVLLDLQESDQKSQGTWWVLFKMMLVMLFYYSETSGKSLVSPFGEILKHSRILELTWAALVTLFTRYLEKFVWDINFARIKLYLYCPRWVSYLHVSTHLPNNPLKICIIFTVIFRDRQYIAVNIKKRNQKRKHINGV